MSIVARFRPYTEDLDKDTTWWHVSDFALGFIAGWGIHPMDIALWGAGGLAEETVEVAGAGTFPTQGLCDTALNWDVDLKFANDLAMKFVGVGGGKFPYENEWRQRYGEIQSHGTAFEGSDGWVHVRRGYISAQPESLLRIHSDALQTKLLASVDHARNFLDAVQSRQATVSPIESAVRADAFCHVSNLAIRLQRKLTYDVKAERFVDDAEANARLKLRAFRAPWSV